jgi:predicted RNA-binding protein associated with RNAse of E/G family
VWLSFLATGEHVGWYINLQKPFHRTPRGIKTMDLMLDVLVDRDRVWRWKDTDDFELLVERQLLDAGIAAEVRRRAAGVIARAEQGEFPFDSTWTNWRPENAWPTPRLPDDWAVLEQAGDAPIGEA